LKPWAKSCFPFGEDKAGHRTPNAKRATATMETSIPMNSESQSDEHWMRIALAEARKGLGATNPNPAAGAVTNTKRQMRHDNHGNLNPDEF